jgi:phage terminase large subunit
MDGIDHVRNTFPRLIFNGGKCGHLIDAIKNYRKERMEDKERMDLTGRSNAFFKDTPIHDWTSHPCDALRYLCWTVKKSSVGDKDDLPQPTAVDDYSYV